MRQRWKQLVEVNEHLCHREQENRKRQRCRYPEPPLHVEVFRIGRAIQRDLFWLKRHSANWTASWADLNDLRMHRAGIFSLGLRSSEGRLPITCRFRRQKETIRISLESRFTAKGAEIERGPVVLETRGRRFRCYKHLANRVDFGFNVFGFRSFHRDRSFSHNSDFNSS